MSLQSGKLEKLLLGNKLTKYFKRKPLSKPWIIEQRSKCFKLHRGHSGTGNVSTLNMLNKRLDNNTVEFSNNPCKLRE